MIQDFMVFGTVLFTEVNSTRHNIPTGPTFPFHNPTNAHQFNI
jgi:hypothetical protein